MRALLADEALLLIVARHQPDQELAAQAAHRTGGAERRVQVADPDSRVDAGAGQRRHHRAGEVTFFERSDAGACRGDFGDQLLVTRTLEDRDGEVLDPTVSREGGPPEGVS